QLARGVAVVERGDQLDRLRQLFHVGRQLGLEVCVEHGELLGETGEGRGETKQVGAFPGGWRPGTRVPLRSCRPGPATASGSFRLPSTWPGTPRPGGWRRTARP